ncbi:hypothetical protein BT67DRAFT_433785 [Trichocladium antarcticum]|uniref:Uncharacterized protein n=1 Tax=Trichocladium antarcticum TaxID=1450529 RepID=A0AAN6UL13_9PEZI|nr:hypothetical protein BT67DRAFT_433785 [Trichocladium antarcticum]
MAAPNAQPRAPALLLRLVRTAAVLLLLPAAAAIPTAPCYFPGGDLAPGYFACIAYGAPVSSCCAPGWTCFSSALCIATTETAAFPNITLGAVQRGACTAPKWSNEFCGSVCLTDDNASGHLTACAPDRYCCAGDFAAGRCSCAEDGGSFVVRAGLAQTIVQVPDASFTGRATAVVSYVTGWAADAVETSEAGPAETGGGEGGAETAGGGGGAETGGGGPPTETAGTGSATAGIGWARGPRRAGQT